MATLERDITYLIADKDEARRIVDEQYALMGITRNPLATAARARELSRAEGINPDDNIFSQGIIEAREAKVRGSIKTDDMHGSNGE